MDTEAVEHLRSFDELLGTADERFFGRGYHRVRHELLQSPSAEHAAHVSLSARIDYPHDWSLGPSGESRSPHLSTIDAVVLSLMALSRANPEDARIRKSRVARVELRAGSEPWIKLSDVPVHIRRSNVNPSAVGEAREIIEAEVGNIRSTIVISRADIVEHADTVLPEGASDVYGELYRTTMAQSTLLGYDPEDQRITARHAFSSDTRGVASGVESAFWPALTVVDHLVTMGQLAQALTQLRHGNARSGGLWMRRVAIDLHRAPEPLPAEMTSVMVIDRDRGVELRGRRYRNIVMKARASSGVSVTAHLAKEELP